MNENTTAAASVAAAFDPLAIEDTHSGEMEVKNPLTGEPTGMVITLAGPEHPDRKRRVFARMRRARAVWSKTQKLPVTDPEEDAADELDDLVACTLGWRGAVMPYTPDAARALYADSKRRWLRDQVQKALSDAELFTRSSAPT